MPERMVPAEGDSPAVVDTSDPVRWSFSQEARIAAFAKDPASKTADRVKRAFSFFITFSMG
jgi:hypothetical protein